MKIRIALVAVPFFCLGMATGYAGQKKLDAAMFRGKPAAEAGKALLDTALVQAEGGSWERIAVGRIFYLGGAKQQGQAIFDDVLAKKHKASDLFRIARVYREAGEWAKAKPLFDQYVKENPGDEKETAEVGAYYLMNGDRKGAEDLFDRSFRITAEFWATLSAAGAYFNVAPQE